MHSFLKKTLSLSLALSLLAGAAGATTLTGLETETVERDWESSLFFPRMEALTGVSMDAHAVSDEAQYANLIAAMAQGSIPADVLFKANLSRAQEQTLLESGNLFGGWPYRLPAAAEYDGASGLRVDQREVAFRAEPVRADLRGGIDRRAAGVQGGRSQRQFQAGRSRGGSDRRLRDALASAVFRRRRR